MADSAGDRGSSEARALADWGAGHLGAGGRITPMAGDASSRRYYRLHHPRGDRVIMVVGAEAGLLERFLHTGELLRRAGLHAPRVDAVAHEPGWVLLEDLGERDYLAGLAEGGAERLMDAALRALVRWQAAPLTAELPPYDAALLERELALFPEWYLGRHLGVRLSAAERAAWELVTQRLIARAQGQAQVCVHRDYMARNLMDCTPLPGIIDHQDAVTGPLTYDLASLLRDAFWEWPAAAEAAWIERYRALAGEAGLPLPPRAVLAQDFDWMAAQRHLKVLGIFARLHHRDGKSRYLGELPRFVRYLYRELAPWPELQPLLTLLERYHDAEGVACTR